MIWIIYYPIIPTKVLTTKVNAIPDTQSLTIIEYQIIYVRKIVLFMIIKISRDFTGV